MADDDGWSVNTGKVVVDRRRPALVPRRRLGAPAPVRRRRVHEPPGRRCVRPAAHERPGVPPERRPRPLVLTTLARGRRAQRRRTRRAVTDASPRADGRRSRPTTCSTTPAGTRSPAPHADARRGRRAGPALPPRRLRVPRHAPTTAPTSWADLGPLASSDGVVVLFRTGRMTPPPGWTQMFGGDGHQMVLTGAARRRRRSCRPPTRRPARRSRCARSATTTSTTMVALVALTEPGPFRPRTIELGGYIGIFHDDAAGGDGRPAARARPASARSSAVCTHPDARRRGYASIVTAARRPRRSLARGETPVPPRRRHQHAGDPRVRAARLHRPRIARFGAYRVDASMSSS